MALNHGAQRPDVSQGASDSSRKGLPGPQPSGQGAVGKNRAAVGGQGRLLPPTCWPQGPVTPGVLPPSCVSRTAGTTEASWVTLRSGGCVRNYRLR